MENMEKTPSDAACSENANKENDFLWCVLHPELIPLPGEAHDTQNIDNNEDSDMSLCNQDIGNNEDGDISLSDEQEFCIKMFDQLQRISENLLKIPNANSNESKILNQVFDKLAKGETPFKFEINEDGKDGKELSSEKKEEMGKNAILSPQELAAKIQELEDRVDIIRIYARLQKKLGKIKQ